MHVPFRDLDPRVREHATLVTVLRNPIERVRSAYRFSRDKARTDFTSILRKHSLDHLVRHWRLFPELTMQLWQPQIVLFFSDDTLPQRRWLQHLANEPWYYDDQCCTTNCTRPRHRMQGRCCPCALRHLRERMQKEDEMTREEIEDVLLVLEQFHLHMLDSTRGRTRVEKLEQHVLFARGRAKSAIQTLRNRYAVVGTLEQLDDTYNSFDDAIPWFGARRVRPLHKNTSPPKDESDWLSAEAQLILREQLLADDLAIYESVVMTNQQVANFQGGVVT